MTPMLTVRSLLERERADLRLVLLAGEAGLGRRITVPRIQKPGLALAGYVRQVHPERVQVLGATEIVVPGSAARGGGARRRSRRSSASNPACVVVTKGLDVPGPAARRVRTGWGCRCCARRWCRRRPSTQIQTLPGAAAGAHRQHPRRAGRRAGRRRAAAGQERHRQVRGGARSGHARAPPGRRRPGRGPAHARATCWSGWASELIKHHMEVRGLGIINIKDMFGIAAVRDEKKIELVLELIHWDENERVRSPRAGRDGLSPSWRCRCRCCGSRSARAATSAR